MLEPPKCIESGQPFARGIHSKIREILLYLERSRLIPGDGIRLMETPCGIEVSSDAGKATPVISIRKKSSSTFPGYTGPWGLFSAGSQIDVNPGLIWTPDGTSYRQPNGISKPGETSYVVISSSGVLSAISVEGGLYDLTRQSYWSDHALLGLYDAENDSLTQYHFSPIVFIIQTEEFIIAP